MLLSRYITRRLGAVSGHEAGSGVTVLDANAAGDGGRWGDGVTRSRPCARVRERV